MRIFVVNLHESLINWSQYARVPRVPKFQIWLIFMQVCVSYMQKCQNGQNVLSSLVALYTV